MNQLTLQHQTHPDMGNAAHTSTSSSTDKSCRHTEAAAPETLLKGERQRQKLRLRAAADSAEAALEGAAKRHGHADEDFEHTKQQQQQQPSRQKVVTQDPAEDAAKQQQQQQPSRQKVVSRQQDPAEDTAKQQQQQQPSRQKVVTRQQDPAEDAAKQQQQQQPSRQKVVTRQQDPAEDAAKQQQQQQPSRQKVVSRQQDPAEDAAKQQQQQQPSRQKVVTRQQDPADDVSPHRDTASRPKGLASSELFLPMLAELFVALFRARCFASLVSRVLRAVEDEIVVDDTFRPYPAFPCETLTGDSSRDSSTGGFSCSSSSSGESGNGERNHSTYDSNSSRGDSNSSTGNSNSSSSGDRRSSTGNPSSAMRGGTGWTSGGNSCSGSNSGPTSGTTHGNPSGNSSDKGSNNSVGARCGGVKDEASDFTASRRSLDTSAGPPASAEAETEATARAEKAALFPFSSTFPGAGARAGAESDSSHVEEKVAEAAGDAAASRGEADSVHQLLLHGSSTSLPSSPLPALFGGYIRSRTSVAGSTWSSSPFSAAAAVPGGLGPLQGGGGSLLRRQTSGCDSRAGGGRGAAFSDYSSRSGCSLSRSLSIPGCWGRLGSSPFGAQVAAGVATDMFSMPFFTKLKLVEAFRRMDRTLSLTKRKVVPPSFNECRMLVNLAQLLASKAQLRLISFDGDETLYPDGANFEDRLIAEKIASLLQRGTAVAVVTAAGYGYDTERYEERLGLLFSVLKEKGLDAEALGHFYVMGGESNYLMRLSGEAKLERVPEELWTGYRPQPCPAAAEELLDLAEAALRKLSTEFRLPASILRKPRGVGLVRRRLDSTTSHDVPDALTNCGMHRENLEEVVIRVRRILSEECGHIPWSAFNGGKDVWVDVGNKAEGVAILQGMLQLAPAECMHVGDQFHATGNDVAARVCSPTVWISNPQETAAVLQELLVAE